MSDKQELIEKIRMLPDQMEALVNGLSEAELTTHYLKKEDGSDEWTVAQNVHHVVDSHMNSYVRCKLLLTENNPTIRPYDQDAWAALPEAKSADLSYSLALLRSLHTRWALFWENLGDGDWARTGVHPVGGPFTLETQLSAYVDHGEGHLDQIKRTLAAK